MTQTHGTTEGSVVEEPPLPAHHFASLGAQAHAARLGMWVFLASEVLLFAALFALFTSYRIEHAPAFREAIAENTKLLGSLNTGILLTSSSLVACSVHALRGGHPKRAIGLVAGTMVLGAAFLCIKAIEWTTHFREGIFPGGDGAYFHTHPAAGFSAFWTLYFGMTGLHALHVVIGLGVLFAMVRGLRRGGIRASTAYRLEIGAIYWHLVDLVWIFLWPLFYLA